VLGANDRLQAAFRLFSALEAMVVHDLAVVFLQCLAHRLIRIQQIFLVNQARLIVLVLRRLVLVVLPDLGRLHAHDLLADALVELKVQQLVGRSVGHDSSVFAHLGDALGGAHVGGCWVSVANQFQIVVDLKAQGTPDGGILAEGADQQGQVVAQCAALLRSQVPQGVRIEAKLERICLLVHQQVRIVRKGCKPVLNQVAELKFKWCIKYWLFITKILSVGYNVKRINWADSLTLLRSINALRLQSLKCYPL